MQRTLALRLGRRAATAALLAGALIARAQDLPQAPPPQNVLQLSATGTTEVQLDLLSMDLGTTRDGDEAATVQRQLTVAVDAALAQLKPLVHPGQLEVHTGHFGLSPRWKDGHIAGWSGTADIVVDGRDFAGITKAASRVTSLTVRSVGFGLSREERERSEREAQADAVQRFRAKADDLVRSFGFSRYSLREVSVSSNDTGFAPVRMMAAPAAAMGSTVAPVPVEAGKTLVRITVSGSVQMR